MGAREDLSFAPSATASSHEIEKLQSTTLLMTGRITATPGTHLPSDGMQYVEGYLSRSNWPATTTRLEIDNDAKITARRDYYDTKEFAAQIG